MHKELIDYVYPYFKIKCFPMKVIKLSFNPPSTVTLYMGIRPNTPTQSVKISTIQWLPKT